MEAAFPFLIERYELRTDSFGNGKHRGGLGLRRAIRLRKRKGHLDHDGRAHGGAALWPIRRRAGFVHAAHAQSRNVEGDRALGESEPHHRGGRRASSSRPPAAEAMASPPSARRRTTQRTASLVTSRKVAAEALFTRPRERHARYPAEAGPEAPGRKRRIPQTPRRSRARVDRPAHQGRAKSRAARGRRTSLAMTSAIAVGAVLVSATSPSACTSLSNSLVDVFAYASRMT